MFRNATPRLSRRRLLEIAATSSLAAVPRSKMTSQSMNIVLVHGAWHGGWCWKKLVPLLAGAGHRVLTPTLTGLGERAHLLSPSLDLTTHIGDVVAVLEYEDLHDVTLVGHSYGGMVITGVEDRVGGRLAHLVYLDAFLPEPGKALADYAPLPPTREDGWRVPPPGAPPRFGVTDERDVAWMDARLGDQPLRTFTERLTASPRSTQPRHSFIQCTAASFFAEAARRAKQWGFETRELAEAGHDAMITRPEALARLLVELGTGLSDASSSTLR